MASGESVTEWLANLKAGDGYAAQRLWQRYYEQLVRLAHRKLGNTPRSAADEEDVVIKAFDSFCRGVDNQRFPELNDRDDLWQVLIVLAERKAVDQRRRECAVKRGGGHVRGGSVFDEAKRGGARCRGAAEITDRDPTPESAAEFAESLRILLDLLGDEELQQIAIAKMQGYENEEIAAQLKMSKRTVIRRVGLIRQAWEEWRYER